MNREQTQLNERNIVSVVEAARVPVATIDGATAAATVGGEVVLPGTDIEPVRPTAIVSREEFENCIPARAFKLDAAAIRVIRELKCPGANDLEVMYFLYVCHALGLNPLLPGQIGFTAYAKEDDDGERRRVVMIEIGGYRNLAARTGRYRQGDPPVLEWPEKSDHPTACTVSLYERVDGEWVRHERRFMWEEFRMFHGRAMWRKNPAALFPKTCEVALIRFYFFDGLAGIYTPEEIDAPDVFGLLGEAKATKTVGQRVKDLLERAARAYRDLGYEKPKALAVDLAKKTVPDHEGSGTWGEAEVEKFAAAVERIGPPPAGDA